MKTSNKIHFIVGIVALAHYAHGTNMSNPIFDLALIAFGAVQLYMGLPSTPTKVETSAETVTS